MDYTRRNGTMNGFGNDGAGRGFGGAGRGFDGAGRGFGGAGRGTANYNMGPGYRNEEVGRKISKHVVAIAH